MVVANVLTCSLPALSSALRLFFRVNKRTHALIVGRVRFDQVDDVKLISSVLARVADFEIVPLGETCGGIVVLANQVILVFVDFDHASEVPRFESALEHQGGIVFIFYYVIRLQTFVISVFLLGVVSSPIGVRPISHDPIATPSVVADQRRIWKLYQFILAQVISLLLIKW